MEALRTKQPDGVRLYMNGQPWDGTIHEASQTPELEPQTEITSALTVPEQTAEEMTLQLTVGPEFDITVVEKARHIVEQVADRLRQLAQWAREVIAKVAAAAGQAMSNLLDSMMYHANDNPKWWHLYKHAKKRRTRKKYRNRLMKQLLRKLEAAA